MLNAVSFSPAFHLYGWCEVVIHVLAITALMNLKMAAPRDFFVVSWVQSAHTCISVHSFNEFDAFFRLLHGKVAGSSEVSVCFQ